MSGRFEGKTVIVTGAAHGLGASHALAFAREGADVAVSDISHNVESATYAMGTEKEVDSVVKKIRDMGRRSIGIKCDVTKEDEVESMVKQTVKEFGKIDILVNNAGIAFVARPFWEVSEKVWDATVDIMLKGTFLCSKHVAPHMIEKRCGKIVNTGSNCSRANRHNAAYSAVKAGIQLFTLAMAKDLGEYNINVNCVSPGSVMTPMMDGACKDASTLFGMKADEVYDYICKTYHILGKEITQDDISHAVLFLASEEARNVNGHTLFVDGGYLAI
jgi:NAD(P)-dependent dehydrogenase (short-subunit alcohol dehydrogenase family)